MPYKHELLAMSKSALIGIGSFLAIQLPDWIFELGALLNGFEGFYKFIIAILTSILLTLQIIKIKKMK